MGFSVSGSFAVVVVASFIALGMFYPAVSNGVDRVTEATRDSQDAYLDQQNTAVEVATATYNTSTDTLTVETNNTGTTTLSLNATDFVIDNGYESPDTTSVDGNADTDLWQPGETLTATFGLQSAPSRVKVVSGPGVSDAAAAVVV